MSIHVRTSIAVLIALSSALLATQYANAQSPSDTVEQATLRELAVQADYSRRDYRAHCLTRWRLLHVRILDPLLVATLALDREDTGLFWGPWCDQGDGSYSLPNYEPVVTIQISPNLDDRSGELRTSFTRMELLRDDILVQPISTRRVRAGDMGVILGRAAYDGLIKYSPEAFAPGAEVILRIWREDNERPITMRLNERLLSSISRNFELYYEAMPSE